MCARWNSQVLDLLETLACRVRLLTLTQIRQVWSNDFAGVGTLRETLDTLVRSGLIEGNVLALPPIPVGNRPLCRWDPRRAEPSFERLRDKIRKRWNREHVATPLVAATERTCRLFGSSAGGMPSTLHINHDLILSEVYVRYRLAKPRMVQRWYGEHAMPMAEKGIKNPDAFVMGADGGVVRVIESSGSYSVRQLMSFHEHCVAESLPYELW